MRGGAHHAPGVGLRRPERRLRGLAPVRSPCAGPSAARPRRARRSSAAALPARRAGRRWRPPRAASHRMALQRRPGFPRECSPLPAAPRTRHAAVARAGARARRRRRSADRSPALPIASNARSRTTSSRVVSSRVPVSASSAAAATAVSRASSRAPMASTAATATSGSAWVSSGRMTPSVPGSPMRSSTLSRRGWWVASVSAESLEDLAQGRAPDDGQPRDGRLDRHGVVTGQQFVEQGLGLTGTGGHAAAIVPPRRDRMPRCRIAGRAERGSGCAAHPHSRIPRHSAARVRLASPEMTKARLAVASRAFEVQGGWRLLRHADREGSAAVEAARLLAAVVVLGPLLAVAHGTDAVGTDATRAQVVTHRVGTTLAEGEVVFGRTDVAGVAFDLDA